MRGLFIKQFVDEGLGNASYLIASEATGQAAVLDPWRDVDAYLQVADGLGLRIEWTLDTHLHADFVSGSHELSHRLSNVAIGASSGAMLDLEHRPLEDGDHLSLGDLTVGVVSTPGHSLEHVSYTLSRKGSADISCLFSGGALIVGGVGRSDLQGPHLASSLAAAQHHSLHQRLLTLSDDVVVYPTHGAGSLCTTGSSTERVTTIGTERQANRFAHTVNPDDFVRQALSDLPPFPPYYSQLPDVNRRGAPRLTNLALTPAWDLDHIARWIDQGGTVIDTRPAVEFARAHFAGSIGIPLETPLIAWAGWLLRFGAPLALVSSDPGEQSAALAQLRRIGYDDIRGSLRADDTTWADLDRPPRHWTVISAPELAEWMRSDKPPLLLDVRSESEWNEGHLPRAIHVDATVLAQGADRIPDDDRPLVAYCARGNRSTIALSLLERRGHHELVLYPNGVDGWKRAGFHIDGGST